MADQDTLAPTSRTVIHARVVLFGVAFVFWLLLVWPLSPIDGRILWADVGGGAIAALVVALVMRDIVPAHFYRVLSPARYARILVYLAVFSWYVIRGNLDVAYRVLHPALPIRPGIVAARTKLRSPSARTLLANSITLTPGTLTVDIVEDVFYIHCINVEDGDEDAFAAAILARFEDRIARILE